MFKRDLRLGDNVDDYCVRCKLPLDHTIVAIVNGEVMKVRCCTCSFEHAYRQGKGGKPKKNDVQSLFDQVASSLQKGGTPKEEPAGKSKKQRDKG
ncbi:MAG: hypothetical protein PHX83_01585 [Acidobacteriia bacterium]|nr:hypothetical protein [Terriglobia bacterium]